MLHHERLQTHDDVATACSAFRQGDVLEDVIVGFTANDRHAITGVARDQATSSTTAGQQVVSTRLPFAILTSQICDIRNPKRMRIRPFLTVARVMDATEEFDAGNLGNIKRGRIGDIVPLTGTYFASEKALWVADLRLESSIERGMLVGRTPIPGFSNEKGFLDFQRQLAAVRGRNAISDPVLQHILRPMQTWLEGHSIDVDLVDEIRIRGYPSLHEATAVELFFLVVDESDPAELQERVSEWSVGVSERLPDGIRLIDAKVVPTSSYTRADEIGTDRIDDLDYLSAE